MRSTARAAGQAGPAWLALALAGAAVLAAAAPAHAQATSAPLVVRVVVSHHTSIRIAQPPSVSVSESDVARGFVEVAAPVEVTVQSNVPEGYALVFERHGDAFREVQVQGLAAPIVVASASAIASRPAAGRGLWSDQLLLRFRFMLAPDTRAGEHRWPVQISLMNQ
jgi:hypothetical protein